MTIPFNPKPQRPLRTLALAIVRVFGTIFVLGGIISIFVPTPPSATTSASQATATGTPDLDATANAQALATTDDSPAPSPEVIATTSPSSPQASLEEELATIDGNDTITNRDTRVSRFRSLLGQLSETFDVTQQQTADQTVKCQEMLQKDGVQDSLLNITEGMNQIFVRADHKQAYSQWLAAYIVLRDKGTSHQDSIEGLKGMAQAFGQSAG